MLISVSNLDAGYGSKRVLSNINLDYEGGCVGLLGPNGAGKSTLLKTILGFIPPIAGSVSVLGLPVPQRALDARSRIGYMPENESFIPGMNAVHFVAYMGRLSGLPKAAAMERAHEVLQYVGLAEARYRNVETYSTGMKQRVKLAQAIVHDPAVLLLDEPTNGMDAQGRTDMLELVADLARHKGIGVILCSHIMGDVDQVASEIIVLGNGQVVAKRKGQADSVGESDKVFAVRLRGPRERFIAAARAAGLAVAAPEDTADLLIDLPAGAKERLIFEAAAAAECLVVRLEQRQEKLQDLFEQALGELNNANL